MSNTGLNCAGLLIHGFLSINITLHDTGLVEFENEEPQIPRANHKVIQEFSTIRRSVPHNSTLFKGQLYLIFLN